METINNKPNLLIVDDEQRIISSIELILFEKCNIFTANNSNDALNILANSEIDIIFLDVNIQKPLEGIDLLKKIKDKDPDDQICVIMLTVFKDIKLVVEAMQYRAFDYLSKPFEPETIEMAIEKALKYKTLSRKIIYLNSEVNKVGFENIIGKSKGIINIFNMITKIRDTDTTVLINGESGTGKELVARAIHFSSIRASNPFVSISCAAIPEFLLETELFGHERGAFTGAFTKKIGKFELSDTGTFFLDEISVLPYGMQSKLLRIIQEKELELVGGSGIKKIDSRIIAATNIDLQELVKGNEFREDLFYRLNVVSINIPPLRDRKEDIPLLINYYIDFFNKKFNKNIDSISEDALNYLMRYNWPGNIRELRNMIERILVLADVEKLIIEPYDLPYNLFMVIEDSLIYGYSTTNLKEAKELFERDFLSKALGQNEWNQSKTADKIGIHRNSLISKMKDLGIAKETVQ